MILYFLLFLVIFSFGTAVKSSKIKERIDGHYVNFFSTVDDGGDPHQIEYHQMNLFVFEEIAEDILDKIQRKMTQKEGKLVEKVDQLAGEYREFVERMGEGGKMRGNVEVCQAWQYSRTFRNIFHHSILEESGNFERECEKLAEEGEGPWPLPDWHSQFVSDTIFAHFTHIKAELLAENTGKVAKFGERVESALLGAVDKWGINIVRLDTILKYEDARLVGLYKNLFLSLEGKTGKQQRKKEEEEGEVEMRLNIPLLYKLILEEARDAANFSAKNEILNAQLQILFNLVRPILIDFAEKPGPRGAEIGRELYEFFKLIKHKMDGARELDQMRYPNVRSLVLFEHMQSLIHLNMQNEEFRHFLVTKGMKSRMASFFGGLKPIKKDYRKLIGMLITKESEIRDSLRLNYSILAQFDDKKYWMVAARTVNILALVLSLEKCLKEKRPGLLMKWANTRLEFTLFVDSDGWWKGEEKGNGGGKRKEGMQWQNVVYGYWKECMDEGGPGPTFVVIKREEEERADQREELHKIHTAFIMEMMKTNTKLEEWMFGLKDEARRNFVANIVGEEGLAEILGINDGQEGTDGEPAYLECPEPGRAYHTLTADKASADMLTMYMAYLKGNTPLPPQPELDLFAFAFHYTVFLRTFFVENYYKESPENRRKYWKFIKQTGDEGEDGWTDEFADRFSEFIRQNHNFLNQMSKERAVPLRIRLCQLHKFIDHWTKDEVLLKNAKWEEELAKTVGLPRMDEPSWTLVECSDEERVDEIARGEVYGKKMPGIHRSNLKNMIRMFIELRNQLCNAMVSKEKLFILLGANSLENLEANFPEILKIWDMEPTFRWDLYEKIFALDPPMENEVPAENDTVAMDHQKSTNEKCRRTRAALRMGTALLLKQFNEKEKEILECHRESFDPMEIREEREDGRDVRNVFRQIRGEFYKWIGEEDNGMAMCLLNSFMAYFQRTILIKNKVEIFCDQVKEGEGEKVALLLRRRLAEYREKCTNKEERALWDYDKGPLADDHVAYLEAKLAENEELKAIFRGMLGVKTRLYLLLGSEDKYNTFVDKFGLVDQNVYTKNDQQLFAHYMGALFGGSLREKLANRLAADLFIWFRSVNSELHQKWEIEENRQWLITKWESAVQRRLISLQYDQLFYDNLGELIERRVFFRGWFEGLRHFVKAEFKVDAKEYIRRLKKHVKKDVKKKMGIAPDAQEILEGKSPPDVWLEIGREGKREGATEKELADFEGWMQRQHIATLREMVKAPKGNGAFQRQIAMKVHQLGEIELESKLVQFFDKVNHNEMLNLFKKQKLPTQYSPVNDAEWEVGKEEKEAREETKKKGRGKKKKKSIAEKVEDKRKKSSEEEEKGETLEGHQNEGRGEEKGILMREMVVESGNANRTEEEGIIFGTLNNQMESSGSEISEKSVGPPDGGGEEMLSPLKGKYVKMEEEKADLHWLPAGWRWADFLKDAKIVEAYTAFIGEPKASKRHLLDIGAFINELEHRFGAVQFLMTFRLKNSLNIFNEMFGKDKKEGSKLAIENLVEEWERMKKDGEGRLKGKVEEEEDGGEGGMGKLEGELYKLLKKVILEMEAILERNKQKEGEASEEAAILRMKRRLHIGRLAAIVDGRPKWRQNKEEGESGDNVKGEEEEGRNVKEIWREKGRDIVKHLFKVDKEKEVNHWLEQTNRQLANWENFKEQRNLDQDSFVDGFGAKYLDPTHFHEIPFDDGALSTSTQLTNILEGFSREETVVKKALGIIKSELDEWANGLGLKYKLLVGGSYQLGIDTVDTDLDTFVVVPPGEGVICQRQQKSESPKGGGEGTSPHHHDGGTSPKGNKDGMGGGGGKISRFEQFFGAEESICIMGNDEEEGTKCPDQSFYCRLCKKKFNNLGKVTKLWIPLISLKIGQTDVDIAFVCAPVENIHEKGENEPDWIEAAIGKMEKTQNIYSLGSYKANLHLLRIFPKNNSEKSKKFRSAIIALKKWAKNASIYGGEFGLFNGAALTMLVAKTCLLYPEVSLSGLLQRFFVTFLTWSWPSPVRIKAFGAIKGWTKDGDYDGKMRRLGIFREPRSKEEIARLKAHAALAMPIITPTYPEQNAAFNVNQSTKKIILRTMLRGLGMLRSVSKGIMGWERWLEGVKFVNEYGHFMVVACKGNTVLGSDHFCDFVQNRIRLQLLFSIESNRKVDFAHIGNVKKEGACPEEINKTIHNPNAQCTFWLVGLKGKGGKLNSNDLKKNLTEFSAKIEREFKEKREEKIALKSFSMDEKELKGKKWDFLLK